VFAPHGNIESSSIKHGAKDGPCRIFELERTNGEDRARLARQARALRSGRRAQWARPSSAKGAYRPRVILLVSVEQMTEMLLAKDHRVIEAVPPDRCDQPLRESILGSSRSGAIPYAHRCETPNESFAIGAIAITNDIALRLTPAAGFGELTGNPFCTRTSYGQPQSTMLCRTTSLIVRR
jgi:hypothetical protein